MISEYPTWVLQRVLEMGSLEDVHMLLTFFGRKTFLAQVADIPFTSPKTALFWREVLRREGISCTKKFSRNTALIF